MPLNSPWEETGQCFRVVQATSLHARDPAWTPEASQGKLGSVCLGQTLFFCVLVFNFPVPQLCQLIPMRSNPVCQWVFYGLAGLRGSLLACCDLWL